MATKFILLALFLVFCRFPFFFIIMGLMVFAFLMGGI